MSKHTLGPWEASEGYPSDIWHVDMPSRGYSVVVSRAEEDWDMAVEEVQANARLIAAAPDLLDALETLLPYLEQRSQPGERWAALCAREAIAKAQGGE
jgi:hypothetical protein